MELSSRDYVDKFVSSHEIRKLITSHNDEIVAKVKHEMQSTPTWTRSDSLQRFIKREIDHLSLAMAFSGCLLAKPSNINPARP